MSEQVALSGSVVGSNAAENSGKRASGRPFTKGDARINRRGRPKTADALRKMIIKIMNEEVSGATPQGTVTMTRVELMLRDWISSRNFQKQNEVMNRGYGKVKDENEVLMHLDLSTLSTAQLERLARGEDLISVLTKPNK